MLAAAFLAGALLAVAGAVPATNATAEPHSLVWPPPQSLIASGAPLPLSADFSITTTHSSATLDQAIARFTTFAAATAAAGPSDGLRELQVSVASADETLGASTDYSYTLDITPGAAAVATAQSVYGAMYALESFTQRAPPRSPPAQLPAPPTSPHPTPPQLAAPAHPGTAFFHRA